MPDSPAATFDAAVVEALRARVYATIAQFEDKEREVRELVVATRRELRETLQQIDLLLNENAKLTTALGEEQLKVAARDAQIAQMAEQIRRLDADVERLENERLSLISPRGEAR